MKVLTAAEMREVDRLTMASGIPGIVLMENAGHRVCELLVRKFSPLSAHHIVVLCGKGNNGGDGLVIARQLHTRLHPGRLDVVLLAGTAVNLEMLEACGCPYSRAITGDHYHATIVIDALLGTGITGPARGPMLHAIRAINTQFPHAKVIAVDIPSGMPSDSPEPGGESARADYTVTFTAPKIAHALPPNCDNQGELEVGAIGSPPSLYDHIPLGLIEPEWLAPIVAPRAKSGHKGSYGHVLVIAGSAGKSGAAAMTGIAALRAGAGLVTVASAPDVLPTIAAHAPELMTEALGDPAALLDRKSVVAIGPGLSTTPATIAMVRRLYETVTIPMVVDADALRALPAAAAGPRILTPHPGEMQRLTGVPPTDRVTAARTYATAHQVTLILKGERTLIAFPDGQVWINPTGTPAMGTGGSGDILTGLIAGFLAQFPETQNPAIAAAVYLHGLAGELAAAALTEQPVIATDLLRYLPQAIKKLCGSVGRAYQFV